MVENNDPNIFVPVMGNVEHYITLNESAIHTCNKIIELLKQKKFLIHKQNLALKRMYKAMEQGNKTEVSASWYESKRWERKAREIVITNDQYAGTDSSASSL